MAKSGAKNKNGVSLSPKQLIIIFGLLVVVVILAVVLITSGKKTDKPDQKEDTTVMANTSSNEKDTFKINDQTVLSNKIDKSSVHFEKNGDLALQQAVAIYQQAEKGDIPMMLSENVDGKQIAPDLRSRVAVSKLRNDDTIGWFRINNSNMNFAVVQNEQDINYYTSKGYDKEYSYYGVIWTSTENKFTARDDLSTNTVMFGHNWKNIYASPRVDNANDIMFEQLAAYCYADYAQSHPIINFSIESEELNWVVVSAFYTEDYWQERNSHLDFNYIDANLTSAQTELFISEIEKRSEFNTDIELSAEDRFLTISTCTRAKGSTDRQRFVVVAKLLGPDDEIPTPTYTNNTSPKAPLL